MTKLHAKREAAIAAAVAVEKLRLPNIQAVASHLGPFILMQGEQATPLIFVGRSEPHPSEALVRRLPKRPRNEDIDAHMIAERRASRVALFASAEEVPWLEPSPRTILEGCRAAVLLRPPTDEEINIHSQRSPLRAGGALQVLRQDRSNPNMLSPEGPGITFVDLLGDRF